jgi:hypothetical protein
MLVREFISQEFSIDINRAVSRHPNDPLKETYNNVHIGKYLSDTFPIYNLKQGDALSPLLFKFALE